MKQNFRTLLSIILTLCFISVSIWVLVNGYIFEVLIAYASIFLIRAIYIQIRDGNLHKKYLLKCRDEAKTALSELALIKFNDNSMLIPNCVTKNTKAFREKERWLSKNKQLYYGIRSVNPKSKYLKEKRFAILCDFEREFELLEKYVHQTLVNA